MINRIVTIAKLVPILVFIVVLVFAMNGGVFAATSGAARPPRLAPCSAR